MLERIKITLYPSNHYDDQILAIYHREGQGSKRFAGQMIISLIVQGFNFRGALFGKKIEALDDGLKIKNPSQKCQKLRIRVEPSLLGVLEQLLLNFDKQVFSSHLLREYLICGLWLMQNPDSLHVALPGATEIPPLVSASTPVKPKTAKPKSSKQVKKRKNAGFKVSVTVDKI